MNNFERLYTLKGQIAVIVGGMGHVGFATAKRLATLEARIICLVRKDLSLANEKMKELPNYESLQHFAIKADVTNSQSLDQAAEIVLKEAGCCHILINAAGITQTIKPNNLSELTDDIFDRILTTNLRGVYSTIRAFAPMLKLSNNGLIVNISSTASLRASNSNVAYAAAKAGLNLMTSTLAKALAPEIRIISIAPGFLEEATSGAIRTEDFNAGAAKSSPLKRIGNADDIACTIESCATTMRFATGSLFVIDGGRTL
ncbi:MAG: SDR family oxidoreductase [Pseudobdellovibrio sp.]